MKCSHFFLTVSLNLFVAGLVSAQWAIPGTGIHSTSNPEIQKVNPKLILNNTTNGTAGIQFNNGSTIDATFGYNESTGIFSMDKQLSIGGDLSVGDRLWVDGELAIRQLSSNVLQFGEPSTGLVNYFPQKVAIGAQDFRGELTLDGGGDTE